MTPEGFPWPAALVAAIVVALLALGAWGGLRLRRWWKRAVLLRRMRHARHGELRAGEWLEAQGFTVLDRQVTRGATLVVDGEPVPFVVRADYLVERDGVRAVVEVKTGAVADAGARETRRQILEYAWVYDVDEVHLFNADARTLQRVAVRAPARAGPRGWWSAARIAMVAFSAGVFVALAVTWWCAR